MAMAVASPLAVLSYAVHQTLSLSFPVQRQSIELPATTDGEWWRGQSLRRQKGGQWTIPLFFVHHVVLQGGFFVSLRKVQRTAVASEVTGPNPVDGVIHLGSWSKAGTDWLSVGNGTGGRTSGVAVTAGTRVTSGRTGNIVGMFRWDQNYRWTCPLHCAYAGTRVQTHERAPAARAANPGTGGRPARKPAGTIAKTGQVHPQTQAACTGVKVEGPFQDWTLPFSNEPPLAIIPS